MIYYAGIGSRETPESLKPTIEKIVKLCNKYNFILRSGGANGADSFFEEYCDNELKEIFLPWKNFNNNPSNLYNVSEEAMTLTSKFHPGWSRLSIGARKLMARNICQVLGEDLKTPTSFVVCWTKDGKDTGGTGQAIRIAQHYNIPIFNLYNNYELELLITYINKLHDTNTITYP